MQFIKIANFELFQISQTAGEDGSTRENRLVQAGLVGEEDLLQQGRIIFGHPHFSFNTISVPQLSPFSGRQNEDERG